MYLNREWNHCRAPFLFGIKLFVRKLPIWDTLVCDVAREKRLSRVSFILQGEKVYWNLYFPIFSGYAQNLTRMSWISLLIVLILLFRLTCDDLLADEIMISHEKVQWSHPAEGSWSMVPKLVAKMPTRSCLCMSSDVFCDRKDRIARSKKQNTVTFTGIKRLVYENGNWYQIDLEATNECRITENKPQYLNEKENEKMLQQKLTLKILFFVYCGWIINLWK